MNNQTPPPETKSSKVEAGAAGISGGTLLIIFANNLSDENPLAPLKSWLIHIAPSVSVLTGVLWSMARNRIDDYFQNRKIKRLDVELQETVQDIVNSPFASEYHEAAQKALLDVKMDKVEQLRASIEYLRKDSVVRSTRTAQDTSATSSSQHTSKPTKQ